ILGQSVSSAQTSSQKAGSPTASGAEESERQLALARIYGLVDRVSAFKDAAVKSLTIARLGNLLWDVDEAYARQLFSKSLDLSSEKSNVSAAEANALTDARREILSLIAGRDAALARRAMMKDSASKAGGEDAPGQMRSNFTVAYDLVKTDPAKAQDFARQSLAGGVHPFMPALLQQLRAKDERAADALFIKALDSLAAEPLPDASLLLLLGTYVFTSPRLDVTDYTSNLMVGVGTQIVPDITADRPGVSRLLVRAYLEAAARILTRPVSDPKQRELYYISGYLLLPKAERFAPELVAAIGAANSALASTVPPQLTQETAFSGFKSAPAKDLDETISNIEKMPGQKQRDIKFLSLFFNLWRRDDFTRAREVADKISDLNVTARLKTLIDFRRAIKSLERGGQALADAEATANKLPKGIERVILWLNIVRVLRKAGNASDAESALSEAAGAARSIDDARRPFLLLNVAGQLARFDASLTDSILKEAVRDFNAQKADAVSKVDWRAKVEIEPVWLYFPLDEREDYGMEASIPNLLAASPEAAFSALMQLTGEAQQSQVILAFSSLLTKPLSKR
ncbi:MAG TPA: hypothetical protein VJS44_20460, partial [Pyrinomonadaceae bacterium]|nr:hypothetical protein [Pyrinomonadaceae bacterium]